MGKGKSLTSPPDGVVWILHSIKPTRCTSLDVRDLIVENLHRRIVYKKRMLHMIKIHRNLAIICVCLSWFLCCVCNVQRWTPRSRLPSLPVWSCPLLRGSSWGWQRGWLSTPSCPEWPLGQSSRRSASSRPRCHLGRSSRAKIQM